jgi:hypothetical protein
MTNLHAAIAGTVSAGLVLGRVLSASPDNVNFRNYFGRWLGRPVRTCNRMWQPVCASSVSCGVHCCQRMRYAPHLQLMHLPDIQALFLECWRHGSAGYSAAAGDAASWRSMATACAPSTSPRPMSLAVNSARPSRSPTSLWAPTGSPPCGARASSCRHSASMRMPLCEAGPAPLLHWLLRAGSQWTAALLLLRTRCTAAS